MQTNRSKRHPEAKALQSPLFRQRVIPKRDKHLAEQIDLEEWLAEHPADPDDGR